MEKLSGASYYVIVPSEGPWDTSNDNIDIQVRMKDGRVYVATLFTVSNLAQLLSHHQQTGECASGTYIWAVQMIVMRDLTEKSILKAIDDLIETGMIDVAMRLLSQDDADASFIPDC